MKKLVLMALLTTAMIAPFAISSASGNRASDAPECCQKKENCCPSQSCCTGSGNPGMCMMHRRHAASI
jgi:hypothetical protein